ncbi:MAG: hypothetical protein LBD77_09540 [Bifidobacteriaceae bacterium]|jgi:hypothetical protein|nr:hypothetical protein [Bifidobacteriaceae bacterium]
MAVKWLRLSLALAAFAPVLALALVGCSSDDGVATLGEKGEASGAASQQETARAMVACLQAAGVPAHEESVGDSAGQAAVGFPPDEHYLLSYGDGQRQAGGYNIAEPDEEGRRLEEMADKYAGEAAKSQDYDQPFLFIGATDHTEAWAGCLGQTGYTEPVWTEAPNNELQVKRQELDAAVAWLQCARDSGYPDLPDPAPIAADNYATRPMALLPADMTEAELRQLLAACPNFDDAAHLRAQRELVEALESGDELPSQFPGFADPVIGFDAPGFNGDTSDGAMDALSDQDLNRLYALLRILEEAANEFDTAHQQELDGLQP